MYTFPEMFHVKHFGDFLENMFSNVSRETFVVDVSRETLYNSNVQKGVR